MGKVLVIAALLLAFIPATAIADFRSYAVVQEDGSLLIQNKLVRLYGIYIPQKGQFCSINPRPLFCGTRAAAALDFKIRVRHLSGSGTYSDGSISAVCWTGRSSSNEERISAPTRSARAWHWPARMRCSSIGRWSGLPRTTISASGLPGGSVRLQLGFRHSRVR
ncbi:MAG: hypothetical protein U1E38_09610 [Rhodospirillales bacterium]